MNQKKYKIIMTLVFLAVVILPAVILFNSCSPSRSYYPWENETKSVQQTTQIPPIVRSKNAKVLDTKYTSKGILVFLELPGNPEVPSDWAWADTIYLLVLMKYSDSTSYTSTTQSYSHYKTAKENFDAGRVREAK